MFCKALVRHHRYQRQPCIQPTTCSAETEGDKVVVHNRQHNKYKNEDKMVNTDNAIHNIGY